jgi:hypothetical protein
MAEDIDQEPRVHVHAEMNLEVLAALGGLMSMRAAENALKILMNLINGAAGDDGAEDARLGELGGGNFGEIV